MSIAEVAWRVKSLVRDQVDRVAIPAGLWPGTPNFQSESFREFQPGFECARNYAALERDVGREQAQAWRNDLLRSADQILQNRISFFAHKDLHVGDPPNWHFDFNLHRASSTKAIQSVNYRDVDVNGDCKEVWEPNRHHQLLVLARAYCLTGEVPYADKVAALMRSWIDSNEFATGMNWRSPLELGVRMINWVWAIELIRESGAISDSLWQDIQLCMYRHCWDNQRKYSRGSSANNHLVGEAAGVFVAASYFQHFPNAAKWASDAKAVLEAEILAQSYADGCTREQALGYQFFVIQFYLVCGITGRMASSTYSIEYWDRLKLMIDFPLQVGRAGTLPLFGDQDDGYVLDFGDHPRDLAALAICASNVAELNLNRGPEGDACESSFWWTGHACPASTSGEHDDQRPEFVSNAYRESGYFLLRSDAFGSRTSILFDCAELGYGEIAAHGHADALSFSLSAYGHYLMVDTGTYDYFTSQSWRNYFRSTAAHNTVEVDGENQSHMSGPFMWSTRANANCTHWSVDQDKTEVTGHHDGYMRLSDSLTHERSISLHHNQLQIDITDRLTAVADHHVRVMFHLGPDCTVSDVSGNVVTVRFTESAEFSLQLDESLTIECVSGDASGLGWYSPGYHQKQEITTIVASRKISGESRLQHRIILPHALD